MRYITKRLTVKNDGFAISKKSARERMNVIRERYINKMYKNGWIPYLMPSGGNAFFYWENYISLCKPKNEEEKIEALKKAEDSNWIFTDNIWQYKY